MTAVTEPIAALTSEQKRALLAERLKKKVAAKTFPLSFAQQRIWFLDQWVPGNPALNIHSTYRVTGALDIAAFARALNEIVRRHEVLRTTFKVVDGQAVQTIAPELAIALPVTDLGGLQESARDAEVLRRASEMARAPFDLANGPLIRAGLLRLSDTEHVLLFNLHHIVYDGWSVAVLIGEVAALYDAFTHGRPSPLPPLTIQYADYAHWQRRQETMLSEQLAYWKARLDGAQSTIDLPIDRARPPVQTFRGKRFDFTLTPALSEAILAFSRAESATPFMTLVAAFNTLLYRYSGQDDINIGTPVAGRNRAETERLIGCFINTLVLRADLSGKPTFRELLRRGRAGALEAFANQDLPFEMLVEALQPERSLSHLPLYQVMFVLQNAALEALNLGGLTLNPLLIDRETAQCDLTLEVRTTDQGLCGTWEYNPDLFDADTIVRMADHYVNLLTAVTSDPDRRIAALPLLTPPERKQLVEDWNATAVAYPQGRGLHEWIAEQAARTPNATALVFDRQPLTYQELDERANQLAHYLGKLGTGPETLVGICVERSLEMVVGLLGILKAGGAYVPIDPGYPAERIAYMLEDSRTPVLLTQERFAGMLADLHSTPLNPPFRKGGGQISLQEDHVLLPLLSEGGGWGEVGQVLCLDSGWPLISHQPTTAPPATVPPNGLAYMIYTSGSTGKPKGAMNTHQAIINRLLWMQDEYRLMSADRVLQKTPFSFDVSVWEFFWPLMTGATLVIAEPGGHQDSAYLVHTIKDQHITTLHFVPSMLQVFLDDPRAVECTGLTRIICSGEALPVELQNRCLAMLPAGLHNLYGPTEAAVDVTFWPCKTDPDLRSVPIGRPIANTQIYILDGELQPVPIGVPGELHIGGINLSRGYWRRPDLTAEKFIPSPFSAEHGARLYKTADLARFRADGSIEYLGRLDHQIKIRGFRIELGEIETALAQQPGIREVVVVAREDTPGDKRLVAYLVSGGDAAPTAGELRAALLDQLPEYMIPAAFVVLDALPLSPNGKVARNLLPAPDGARPELTHEYVAPRNPVEEALAEMWSDILGVERVGITDNFFELGGHSLLLTQLASRIWQDFEVEVPLRVLFDTPTVAEMVLVIFEYGERAPQASPLVPISRDGALPLSFAQQRLWFIDQLQPGSSGYNVPSAVRLNGTLDSAALTRSLNEIVGRHEALRTTFQTVSGQPVAVIAASLDLPLPLVDLSTSPLDVREAETQRLAEEEARGLFELAVGPLVRAKLLRLGDDEHVLLFTMHHIVSDGWSLSVLIQEVAALYAAYVAGQPSPLPELAIQYADFAAWQRDWLQGDVLRDQLAHWKTQLAGVPAILELPTDRPRPPIMNFDGARFDFTVPRQIALSLDALSRRENATLFMTLLAAFQVLLARYSNQEDLVVGTPIAGRNRAETEALIGFFVNTLVLRTDLSGNPAFTALVRRVREVALGAYSAQDVPFEKLVDEVQPERDLSRNPLFQVMFVLQNTPMPPLEAPGLTLSPIEIDSGLVRHDLRLGLTAQDNGDFAGSFEYRTDLFEAATIARMAEHLQTLLDGIAADPEQRLYDLPLLTDSERAMLLTEWNDTRAPYPQDLCLHTLFERQAERAPHAVALVFEGRTWTYAEVNRLANQLARHLLGLGIGRGQFVGVLMNRSMEMIPALLGILKSGAAYVPMEVSYPAARIQWILESLDVPCVITQSAHVETLRELREQLPRLGHVVCLDSGTPLNPPLEQGGGKISSQMGLERNLLSPSCSKEGLGEVPERLESEIPAPPPYEGEGWEEVNLWNRADLAHLSPDNPPAQSTPDDLAYVIFTSGSTGTPKGVVVQHKPIINLIHWVNQTYEVGPSDRVLFITSLCFDLSVYDMFGLLAAGASIRIASDDDLRDAARLLRILAEEPITFWDSAPPALQQLAPLFESYRVPTPSFRKEGEPGFSSGEINRPPVLRGTASLGEQGVLPSESDAGRAGSPSLRLVFLSGDWIPVTLPDAVRATFPGARVISLGGATEAAVWSNFYPIGRVEEHWVSIPYGKPIPNARYHVLDSHLNPAPIGVPGDLYIGGECLASCYANDPILTASKFIPDPFSTTPNDRLYRTGDRARYWADGNLEFLGRADFQVKIRGFRIELGEIEAVLKQHPALETSVVIAREDIPGNKRLVAYLVPKLGGEAEITVDGLRALLQGRLPEYMVPSAFVILDSLPLTLNGKLDRKGLPAPGDTGPGRDEDFVAPTTETERILAEVWSEVLGVERIGVHDNFFTLGGDSILSIQIIARASQRGLQITPRDMFQHQTIASLAAVAVGGAKAVDAEQGPVTGLVPLTPIQHWFFERDVTEPHHWNQSFIFTTPQTLDFDILRQVAAHLLTHHDALRLRFTRGESGWRQVNAAPGDPQACERIDLSHVPESEQRAAIEAAADELQTRFHLESGPLMRLALFDLGPNRAGRLMIIMHHLVTDGISWRIVLENLQLIYQQVSAGSAIALPPKSTSFKQWAERLMEYAAGEDVLRERDYWLAGADAQVYSLPVDYLGGENTVATSETHLVYLDEEETRQLLQEVPAAYHTQINDVLLTALAQAFAAWTGDSRLLVDLEGHGREDLFPDLDLSRTVGWCTSLYPVVLDVNPADSQGDALKSIKEQLRAVPNKGVGYGVLRYLAGDEALRDRLQSAPKPEIAFNYLGQFDQVLSADSPIQIAWESSGRTASPRGSRGYLLNINGAIVDGRFKMGWSYSTSLHRSRTIENLADGFIASLRALIAHCVAPEAAGYTPSDFPEAGLSQEELDALFADVALSMEGEFS